MKKQTWQQWARSCAKDPDSPSQLRAGSLAALTGQDDRAISVFVAALELYSNSDADGERAALIAMRAALTAMQEKVRWIARELIPFVLCWDDRELFWPRVESPPQPTRLFENDDWDMVAANPLGRAHE